MRNLVLSFAAGIGLGAGGCYFYFSKKQGPSHDQAQLLNHPALKLGMPTTEALRAFDGFVTAFDFRTRNPKWVVEHITRDSVSGEADRDHSNFFEDTTIEARFRSKLSDYKNSGYDRGHMAPAANHKGNQQNMDDTFTLCNISPQVGKGFNRAYWARFEKFVKDVTKAADDVYVVTGPLWMPAAHTGDAKWEMRHTMIGEAPSLVSVPTHFYKVVLAEKNNKMGAGSTLGVAAFVMPNAPIEPGTPLTAYTVPLEALEAVAGTKFFPGALNDARRRAVDDAAHEWRVHGLQQMRAAERHTLLQESAALPALPPPGGSAVPVAGGSEKSTSSWRGKKSAAAPPAVHHVEVTAGPKTKPGTGAVHLCDMVACKLPAPFDFENKQQEAA